MNKYVEKVFYSFSIFRAMPSSICATLAGDSASLSARFHPEIVLDDQCSYSCSLIDFSCDFIPNVNSKNNKLHWEARAFFDPVEGVIEIPPGNYQFEEIAEILIKETSKLKYQITKVTLDEKSMTTTIETSDINLYLDFDHPDSIGMLLGFDKKLTGGHKKYVSQQKVNKKFHLTTSIRIDCDLVTGAFHNGNHTHTLHEFIPHYDASLHKIEEQPINMIYLPIARRRINYVNISVLNQNGEPIDFQGGHLRCRIHVKKD